MVLPAPQKYQKIDVLPAPKILLCKKESKNDCHWT